MKLATPLAQPGRLHPMLGRFGFGVLLFVLACSSKSRALGETSATPDFGAIQQIFADRCLDCHGTQEPEAKLVLDSYESLSKGGESGLAVVPGKSSDSLLVKMMEGTVERDGKRKIMPPGKRAKLASQEIAAIRAWVDAGAPAPATPITAVRPLVVPHIKPKVPPRQPIQALAYSPPIKLMAAGRFGVVQLISSETRALVRTLEGHPGNVNALAFSSDGKLLYAAGGDAGLSGEVREWNVGEGSLVRVFAGHKDAIYSTALSPDGRVLATGSYDQQIKLWDAQTGQEIRTLKGHNGAVFGLAFRPDGRILASASADRTVKLWEVQSGERRDTLSQSLKEVYAVAFSLDGKRLYAGGTDNRLRLWEISEKALETTNPILESRFAHEGAITSLSLSRDGKSLVSSASDQTVKIWDAATLTEKLVLERQPDWAPAVTFLGHDKSLVVGRLDGSSQWYDTSTGKVLPPPKPELTRAEPRGLQRGTEAKVQLIGSNLTGIQGVKASDPRLSVELDQANDAKPTEAWIRIRTPADLPRGAYELWLTSSQGETGKIKLYIDDLRQLHALATTTATMPQTLGDLPVTVWASHDTPGQTEEFSFEVRQEQALVFDVAAKTLSSKADIVLTLMDSEGKVLADSNGFDRTGDALLFYTFSTAGTYRLRVSDLLQGGSREHFYRLSIGTFPFVTGCFPLGVPINRETEVALIGFNLPAGQKVKVHPERAGELDVPLDNERFRTRQALTVLASDSDQQLEVEPNDAPAQATAIHVPGVVDGQLWKTNRSADVDLFRFDAKAGQSWVIETVAAQHGSPADTRIEVLYPDGRPVERLLLQAVRDSAVTFRGIDSDATDCRLVNWEEMELNQDLYLQGEVLKLFRAPQGPDSGFVFYTAQGKRRGFFDTSAAAHAVDAPCYIVEPHPPGTKLVSNGLPVFPLYFENDDDAERALGTDSRIHFAAPEDGPYLVRVTDTRAWSGERYVYRLVVRPSQPDFTVSLRASNLSVNRGSGQGFTIDAQRVDGFDGEIRVDINHLPAGFTASTPLVIEAGQAEAHGTIHVAKDAPSSAEADWARVEVTASALVDGRPFVKALNNFGTVKLADAPKLFVFLEQESANVTSNAVAQASTVRVSSPEKPCELTIAPGQTIPALLRVQRNGHDDLITFTVENLPHGVIVDNIGLNGVLIPKEQNERQIFLSAARWVPETDRLCYAVENQAGRQTSLPVLLHVRRSAALQASVGR